MIVESADFPNAGLLGKAEQVDVSRAIVELRAGRPVIVRAADEMLAMPIDRLDTMRLAEFGRLTGGALPRLAITRLRAEALGLVAEGPLCLELPLGVDAKTVMALVFQDRMELSCKASAADALTSGAVHLAKLAQVLPAVLVAQLVAGTAAANANRILSVGLAGIARYGDLASGSLVLASEAQLPLANGISGRMVVFRDGLGQEPAALVVGNPDPAKPVPVRIHSACLTGDVFGSRRCDCGEQLRLSLRVLDQLGGGVVLYLAQEGRGLGLANKMRTYRLQDGGLDTVDANTTLGFEDDERDYRPAARMLHLLGWKDVLLLTNNPAKLDGLASAGITVTGRLPLEATINSDNHRYMSTKAVRAGHQLENLPSSASIFAQRVGKYGGRLG